MNLKINSKNKNKKVENKCEGLYLLMSKKFKLKRFYYAFSILQRFDPKPNKFKYCGLFRELGMRTFTRERSCTF